MVILVHFPYCPVRSRSLPVTFARGELQIVHANLASSLFWILCFFFFLRFKTGPWYTAPVFFIPEYVLSLSYGVNILDMLRAPSFHLPCLILGAAKPTLQANAGLWALAAGQPGNQGLHDAQSPVSCPDQSPTLFLELHPRQNPPPPPWTVLQLTRQRRHFANGDPNMGFSFLFPGGQQP